MRIHTFYSGWGCAVWRRPWRTPPIGGAVQQMSVRYATVTSSQKNPPTYWSQGHQVGIHFKHSLVPQNPISHRLQTHCSSRLAGSGQRARAMTLWPMHLPWKLPLCLSLGMTGISCQDLPGRLVCALPGGGARGRDVKLKPCPELDGQLLTGQVASSLFIQSLSIWIWWECILNTGNYWCGRTFQTKWGFCELT